MILTIIQSIIFISYVTFLMIKFKGPLSSISDSWYKLSGVYKNLFTLFCWSLGFTLFFQTNGTSAMFFISGVGLSTVGVATMFNSDKIIKIIHYSGASICILFAFLALYIERHTIIPFIIFFNMFNHISII